MRCLRLTLATERQQSCAADLFNEVGFLITAVLCSDHYFKLYRANTK